MTRYYTNQTEFPFECMCCNVWHFSETGLLAVKVEAVNVFSISHVDVDLKKMLQACQNYSVSQDGHSARVANVWERVMSAATTEQLCFCVQKDAMTAGSSDLKIHASPDSLVDWTQRVTLTGLGVDSLHSKQGLDFEWKCSKLNSHSHIIRMVSRSAVVSHNCH